MLFIICHEETSYLQGLQAVQSLEAVLSKSLDHVVMKMPERANIH